MSEDTNPSASTPLPKAKVEDRFDTISNCITEMWAIESCVVAVTWQCPTYNAPYHSCQKATCVNDNEKCYKAQVNVEEHGLLPTEKQSMRNEWKPKHPFRQPTKLLVIGSTNVQAHSPVNYQCATVLTIMAKRLEESHFMVPSRTGATRKNKVPRMFYGVQNTTTANRSTNFENVRRFREQKC